MRGGDKDECGELQSRTPLSVFVIIQEEFRDRFRIWGKKGRLRGRRDAKSGSRSKRKKKGGNAS